MLFEPEGKVTDIQFMPSKQGYVKFNKSQAAKENTLQLNLMAVCRCEVAVVFKVYATCFNIAGGLNLKRKSDFQSPLNDKYSQKTTFSNSSGLI